MKAYDNGMFPRLAGWRAALLLMALICPPLWAENAEDSKMTTLAREADSLVSRNLPVQAIAKCNEIIATYEKLYKDSKERIYCARTSQETLFYLLDAAVGGANDGKKSIAIGPQWATAYFLKAYALVEMNRFPEAKENILMALELSPVNSQYLCELGNIYQADKDWKKAKEAFKKAEDNVNFSPDSIAATEKARAQRSYAYCLIEEGDLNGAEKIYQECLKVDPNDARAKNELEYIRQVREKSCTQP